MTEPGIMWLTSNLLTPKPLWTIIITIRRRILKRIQQGGKVAANEYIINVTVEIRMRVLLRIVVYIASL